MVKLDLSDKCPCLAVDLVGDAKQMDCRNDKEDEGYELEKDYSGNFHEHGIGRVVVVNEDGGHEKEQKRSYPSRTYHPPDSFFRHERDVAKRSCDGKVAIDRHGQEIGVGTIHKGEADFEKEPGMVQVDGVEELCTKERWKEC